MEAARRLVGLAGELAARVQRAEDDLERDLPGNFGCGSTGMPRPLSRTVTEWSAWSSTSMRVAWPATASSIELSRISATRWCSARSSVPPIYMPGRLRTARAPRAPRWRRRHRFPAGRREGRWPWLLDSFWTIGIAIEHPAEGIRKIWGRKEAGAAPIRARPRGVPSSGGRPGATGSGRARRRRRGRARAAPDGPGRSAAFRRGSGRPR